MTTWTETLVAEAEAPDTLAAIIDSMRGVIELAESMLPEPTKVQMQCIYDESKNIHSRVIGLLFDSVRLAASNDRP